MSAMSVLPLMDRTVERTMPFIGASARGASVMSADARLAQKAREGSPRELAYEAAKTLVVEAFVKPIFAQLHEGSLASDAFKPGVGEKRFRPLLDAALADKVVEGSNFALVQRVADRFERSITAHQGGTR